MTTSLEASLFITPGYRILLMDDRLVFSKVQQDFPGLLYEVVPFPVAARACGRSPAAIASSNPAGGMDVCLL
jgi:hypothetical protein